MSLKKWFNDHNIAISCLATSVLVALLYLTAQWLQESVLKFPYYTLEQKVSDWVAELGKSAPRDPRIYFLADDAPSHDLSQAWPEDFAASPILRRMQVPPPWPRDVYAAILDRLASSGARVVGFDYLLKGQTAEDPILREAVDKYSKQVVFGSQIEQVSKRGPLQGQINTPPATILGEASDPRLGFVNMYPDPDGVVRRFLFRTTRTELVRKNIEPLPNDPVFESLAVRILRQAGIQDLGPTAKGKHMLRFTFKGETLGDTPGTSQSAANIFIPETWEKNYKNGAFFKDKIVLVGPEGNYHKDVLQSPFGIIGGPEFHLNAMNAILTGSFLTETSPVTDVLLILLAGVFALIIGHTVRNPLFRIVLAILIASGGFLAAVWFFNHENLVSQPFSPILTLAGSTFVAIVWQQLIERLEKAKLRHTFERYVSRDVVKELVDNPQSFLNSLVGVRKNVTVLFSDVRGFTTITQTGDATQLVAQLNEYFDHMVNIVFANRGTLDKFIGDAVMAQWGGITTSGEKEDAVNAVRAAVQMRAELVDLNKVWIEQGRLDLKIGIGINHGEAIVGNLGSEAKSEISLIGDAVNTASRFEGMTKQYHVDLIIGENVAALVRDRFIIRTIAQSQPKGTLKPIEIFTVLRERTNGSAEPAWLASYEEGVTLYRGREFAKAAERFESVLTNIPNDWLCESYLAESRKLAANPPPPDWSPVDVLTSK
jgi:adenylate cyclase